MFTGTLSPVSNKADWIETFELYDDETGEAIDVSAATEITIAIREPGTHSEVLSGSLTGDEIEHVETGVIQWHFTADQMSDLCAKTYEVGMTLVLDDITTQILIGHLPVADGIVS